MSGQHWAAGALGAADQVRSRVCCVFVVGLEGIVKVSVLQSVGRCGRRWRNSLNPVNRVGSIALMAAYQRGTQAPMDITELGPRKRTLEKTCVSLGL